MIPDALYCHRRGGTDSEAIFLIALGRVERDGPIAAFEHTLATVRDEMDVAGIDEPLRFSAALTDGQRLQVFRWSSDPLAPSVYYRQSTGALVVVSEPLDDDASGCWRSLPANHVLEAPCAGRDRAISVTTFGLGSAEALADTDERVCAAV
jgi:glutamine amidotransferase